MGDIDQTFIDELKFRCLVSQTASQFMQLEKRGREFWAPSPFKNEKIPSFSINDQKGFYHCFATGQHGDVIDLVQHFIGSDWIGAVRYLADQEGLTLPGDERKLSTDEKASLQAKREARQKEFQASQQALQEQLAKEEKDKQQKAGEIWGQALFDVHSPVFDYLTYRGIDVDALKQVYGWPFPPSLRFHPDVWHSHGRSGPAMVGILQDRQGVMTGIHRTWIKPDGTGKADFEGQSVKKFLGKMGGAGVRLSDVGETVLIGEGIETTLTMMAVLARRGQKVFGLCGVSLGNIAGAEKKVTGRNGWVKKFSEQYDPERPGLLLPKGVKRVRLLMDADGKDPEHDRLMMRRAAFKFRKSVRDVAIVMPEMGKDFNDMALSEG